MVMFQNETLLPRRSGFRIPFCLNSFQESSTSGLFLQNISAVIRDFNALTRNCGVSTILFLSSGRL